jgi:hypothetical protein
MAETIDVESRKASQLVTDIDKQRRRYIKKSGDVKVQFVSPSIFNYERFFFYLLRNSTYSQLGRNYIQRPDYLSYDQYSTTTLWPVLLFVNRVQSIEDFVGPTVYIPSYSSILELSKNNQTLLDSIDLDKINEPNLNIKKLQVYYSKVRVPTSEAQPRTPTTEDQELPSYLRQKFNLVEMNLLNKFVDLGFIPVQETVEVKIVNSNQVLVYDAHFTIIADDNGDSRRVSWAEADCVYSPYGMEDTLTVGTVLDISYVKEQ